MRVSPASLLRMMSSGRTSAVGTVIVVMYFIGVGAILLMPGNVLAAAVRAMSARVAVEQA